MAIYLMQEGIAQQTKPHFIYFVDFPTQYLPAVYAAAALLIINLAFLILSLLHRTAKHRWPWLVTAVAVALLGLIVWQIGLDGVRIIIDPSSA